MSVPTLSELIAVHPQDYWTALALAQLQGRNFPTTDWTSTSPERAMLETDTACIADLSDNIPLTVQLALVYYALLTPNPDGSPGATAALQFLAYNWYQLTPFPATATEGRIRLYCNANAGPYTITAGQLTAISNSGLLYVNTTGGTLATPGTLDCTFQCQQVNQYATTNPVAAQVNGNVANNTILALQTPLPGVSIANVGTNYSAISETSAGSGDGTLTLAGTPTGSHSVYVVITGSGNSGVATWSTSVDGGGYVDQGAAASVTNLGGYGINITLVDGLVTPSFNLNDTFSFSTPGSWVTTSAAFPESQVSLAGRILARWPSLAAIPNSNVYETWALEAGAGSITRATVVTDPTLSAVVNIYIAQATSSPTLAQIVQTQTYIGTRAPITDLPQVVAPSTFAMTLSFDADYPADRPGGHADLDALIDAYVQGVPIGGTVECARVTAIAMQLDANGTPTGATNISNVDLGSGVGVDVSLGTSTIVEPYVNTGAWTPVTS